jgi:hypothetical protein
MGVKKLGLQTNGEKFPFMPFRYRPVPGGVLSGWGQGRDR